MFICWQKINFIPHVFLEIFKDMETFCFGYFWHPWLCSPKVIVSTCRKCFICMSKTNFVIHFFLEIFHFKECCQQYFGPILLKPCFGTILGPFWSNVDKKEFSWKKGLCKFLNIPVIYQCAKNQKKLMTHSWQKCRNDGRTDGADRQQWFYRTPCWMEVQKER